ncbi:MAG: radical SAM protein [Lachnospiraceae bacterium]|nr:radical SAM protein [Lachnospiraceae bacterium]
MEEIKRLILGLIPNQKCNLRCEYCYISQVNAWEEPTTLKYSVEYIARCLSKERLGGTSLINLTGNGETMLQPDIVPLTGELLKQGHYVEIVTNGTITKHINDILTLPDELLSHLFFKISFHYKELKRRKMLSMFWDNIAAIKKSAASFSLELLAYDGIEEDIDEIKKICYERAGAICHATIGRNDKRRDKALLSGHSIEEFSSIWKSLESPMAQFKLEVIGKKRKEFCYAGDWSLFVNMYTGESQPCYWQPYNQNIFENSEKPIKFYPVGHTCTQPYCTNAHAHMAWGVIPELYTPSYAEMRNRKCLDGSEWLKCECKSFFSSKLQSQNREYSTLQKIIHDVVYPIKFAKWMMRDWKNNIRRIKNYLKRIKKKS